MVDQRNKRLGVMDHEGMIFVDFDGTLAIHHPGQEELGKAIPPMLNRVKRWVADGDHVVIFTARATTEDQKHKIQDWLEAHDLPRLEVTNIKSPLASRFYDDKAIAVSKNKGLILTERRSSHRRISRK